MPCSVEVNAPRDRVMCIALRPAVIGQAQRARYADLALRYVRSFPDVWLATGRRMAEHYMTHGYDAVAGRIATWRGGMP